LLSQGHSELIILRR